MRSIYEFEEEQQKIISVLLLILFDCNMNLKIITVAFLTLTELVCQSLLFFISYRLKVSEKKNVFLPVMIFFFLNVNEHEQAR
jgi:hypothetical protein